MNISSFSYLFKEGIKNLIHNKLMSLASIGVLTACLMVIGFSSLLSENLNKMVDLVSEQSTIVFFLKDETTPEQLENLNQTLKKNEKVKKLKYTSKEQALKDFSKVLNNNDIDQLLLEKNILPASVEVIVKHVSYTEEVVATTADFNFIESTKVPSQIANTIKEMERILSWFEIILIIALIIISLVIISNTIRATVFARRREIAIMKQVGATDNFVRLPFVVEGMLIGIISAVIAFITISIIYKTILIILTNSNSLFLISIFSRFVNFNKISYILAINFAIGGIGAGVFGSLLSLKKYLKT